MSLVAWSRGSRRDLALQPGSRFGRWRVLFPAAPTAYGKQRYLCQCACGRLRVVQRYHLVSGASPSCGCLSAEKMAARNRASTRHGESASKANGGKPTVEYSSWGSMLARCRNPAHKAWKHYGGRGITVCGRWDPRLGGSYANFLADMGRCPDWATGGLDRENVNGNYEPHNCRWATAQQQTDNRRCVVDLAAAQARVAELENEVARLKAELEVVKYER